MAGTLPAGDHARKSASSSIDANPQPTAAEFTERELEVLQHTPCGFTPFAEAIGRYLRRLAAEQEAASARAAGGRDA